MVSFELNAFSKIDLEKWLAESFYPPMDEDNLWLVGHGIWQLLVRCTLSCVQKSLGQNWSGTMVGGMPPRGYCASIIYADSVLAG